MRPRNTPNGDTHDGMMTAHGVLTSPIEWNIRYSGTVISATGNSSPARTMPCTTTPPGVRNLLRPYPAATDTRVPTTPATSE